MIFSYSVISILEVLIVTIPALLVVAFVTIAERKTMASMQRRLGPNLVGYYGLLQAFADALKLLLKEYISPTQANFILFFIGPIITLVFSLLGYGVIPYAPSLAIIDLDLGILYLLAVSSLATYGILLAGWSANSKYAFLGSLRSTAQLISYELILSSAILIVIFLTGTLNLTLNLEYQKIVWFIFPLFPIFLIFFIGSVAETNRAPFDLAEAESELVSGFMTEHSAVVFVFFFLAEYASIVLICMLTSILFLGGYFIDIYPLLYIYGIAVNIWEILAYSIEFIMNTFTFVNSNIIFIISCFYASIITVGFKLGLFLGFDNVVSYFYDLRSAPMKGLFTIENKQDIINAINYTCNSFVLPSKVILIQAEDYIYISDNIPSVIKSGYMPSIILGIKTCAMIFIFIWARASFPRIRFDQLMSYCWTVLLPLVVAFIIIIPCVLYGFDILPNNIIVL